MPPYEFRITSPETPDLQIEVKLPDEFTPLFRLTRGDIVRSIARAAKLKDSKRPMRFEVQMVTQEDDMDRTEELG